jgi:cathepsin L
MKEIAVKIIILSIISLSTPLQLTEGYTFEDYVKQFNKVYKSEFERQLRERIFYHNVEKIIKLNSESKTGTAGINNLTDRTHSEMKAMKGRIFNKSKFQNMIFLENTDIDVSNIPKEINWVEKGIINDVINQGDCGSCWAFSTIANVEAHLAINTNKLIKLSEQQLVSCVPNPAHCGGKGGCDGAVEELGFEYIKQHGITLDSYYPYLEKNSPCNHKLVSKKVATIEGFVKLPKNNNKALLHAIATIGPVSVGVDASSFQLYESGVWSDCGMNIDHAVLAVGYGIDEEKGPYWLLKNTWGPDWGENGYIRIKREIDDNDVPCDIDEFPENGSACEGDTEKPLVCGTCGVLFENTYPIGVKLSK